jgi:hypothetical protein
LVFTIEGKLIGDGASFVEHVREHYGKVIGLTPEMTKRMRKVNEDTVNEEMRKKQDGSTLGEKIAKSLEKIKSKQDANEHAVISNIDDAFFAPQLEQDCNFYLRRTNLFRPARAKDVPDELAIARKI